MPITARFVVSAAGILSCRAVAALSWHPYFQGRDVSHWPVAAGWSGFSGEPSAFTGKRVGHYAYGFFRRVQIIATLGPVVNKMVVFQRTPNWCLPLGNHPFAENEVGT